MDTKILTVKRHEQKHSLWNQTQAPVPVGPYHLGNSEANYTISLSFTFLIHKTSKSCHFFAHRMSNRALLETAQSLTQKTWWSGSCHKCVSAVHAQKQPGGNWPLISPNQPPWTDPTLNLPLNFTSHLDCAYLSPTYPAQNTVTVLCVNWQTSIWVFSSAPWDFVKLECVNQHRTYCQANFITSIVSITALLWWICSAKITKKYPRFRRKWVPPIYLENPSVSLNHYPAQELDL